MVMLLKTENALLNTTLRTPLGGAHGSPVRPFGRAETLVASNGGLVMRHVDFTPFYRSTVGFDRLLDLLGSGSEAEANVYPPYNIERLSDNEYRITMAVAGFSQDELKIDVKEQALNVRGEKKAEDKG